MVRASDLQYDGVMEHTDWCALLVPGILVSIRPWHLSSVINVCQFTLHGSTAPAAQARASSKATRIF
jgi:hypothetical protein